MHIPTANELRDDRGLSTQDRLTAVHAAMGQHGQAAARLGATGHASDKRAGEKHMQHFVELSALADEIEQGIDMRERMAAVRAGDIAGRDGAARQDRYRSLERLSAGDSVADWVKSRGLGGADVDVNAAWTALGRGLLADDWSDWQRSRASLGMTTSESSPGGGYIVPDVMSASVIDKMRSSTPIFAAGARIVPMTASTLDIARITGDPTASWHSEAASITPSDVTLDRVRFTARTLPVIVKASTELVEDALNLGEVLSRAIAGAIGVELTRVALRGSGVAPEPQGIRNQSGVTLTALGANGGAVTWDVLIDEAKNVLTSNAVPGALIWHPRTAAAMAKTKDTTNQYIPAPEPVSSLQKFQTTTLPTNITKGSSTTCTEVYTGDFSQLLVGMRTSLQLKRLDERYADTLEVGFLAFVRVDVQLEHGAAFSVITDATN